jgi:carboxy-terminal domain RNA polymerase II polypeptide A small phosphatase
MAERMLLVLDLDETLVHATAARLSYAHHHQVGPYLLYQRPGLVTFLQEVAEDFQLGVWTSSSPAYAGAVCSLIFPDPSVLQFIWASDRCTLTRNFESGLADKAKPLRKLKRRGYDLARTVVVDDSPEKHTRNYGNLVQVAPFTGRQDDDELTLLTAYLRHLSTQRDIRSIEKRQWRKRMTLGLTLSPPTGASHGRQYNRYPAPSRMDCEPPPTAPASGEPSMDPLTPSAASTILGGQLGLRFNDSVKLVEVTPDPPP